MAPLYTTKHVPCVHDYVNLLGELYRPDNIILGSHEDQEVLLTSQDLILEKLHFEFIDVATNIILISPEMLDQEKSQMHQWLPREIYFIVNQIPRNKTVALILPDAKKSHDYARYDRKTRMPEILYRNIDCGLIPTFKFDAFLQDPDARLRRGFITANSTPEYKIRKTILPE